MKARAKRPDVWRIGNVTIARFKRGLYSIQPRGYEPYLVHGDRRKAVRSAKARGEDRR